MKKLLTFLFVILSIQAYSQQEFSFAIDGISPTFLGLNLGDKDTKSAYQSALEWLKNNADTYQISVVNKKPTSLLEFTSVKNNAVNLDKQYFHAEYHFSMVFEKNQMRLTPKKIRLKLNSKYDMGWKDFDLSTGSQYFKKKNKPIRKYKSYLNDLVNPMNNLAQKLANALNE